MPTVGILAIQGDVIEHRHALERIGAQTTEIRLPDQLDGVDGLIIPGGESTTIVQLIDIYDLRNVIRDKVMSGLPTWGTCAGMIVLADRLTDRRPDPLHLMNIEVSRNAFGRQVDSFEQDLEIDGVDGPPFRGVFIRAPAVNSAGAGTEILARLDDGRPVAVRQGSMLATSFHPELTDDSRVHQLFVRMIENGG